MFQLDSSPLEDRFPHLHAYARDSVGPDATVMDGYVHYLNTVAEHLRANGKTQVRAWNDAVHTPGTTVALNEDIAYWTMWHESMPSVETLLRHGHRLINFSDRYFYYVLTSPDRAYFTKPSAEAIHAEWTPGTFPGPRGGEPQMIADDDAALLGASFSIWCDVPDAETQQEVAEGIRMPLRAMASKSWNPASTETYSDWSVRASSF